jgi:predicted NBD/HSP70 family sugar kinase
MATSSHLRKINQRKIVHSMLRLHSTASRTKLAEIAGMSQATVGRIVDDLLTQSILAEVVASDYPTAPDLPQLGRPSKLLELDRAKRRFLLIHLGVRQTRLAAMPVAIPEMDRWAIEFNTPRTKEEWFAKLARACRKIPLRGIDAIILSCPGVVDESAERVLLCPNIHWAEETNFTSGLRSIARLPVVFLQEIRALALGQLTLDSSLRDFLLVDIGDGIGGASIVGARLETGHLPLSGELGHTPVFGNDRRCGCGSIGCIETLISSKGLLKSLYEHTGLRTWNTLVSLVERQGMPDWFKLSLDAAAITVAGALNVEGIANVVFTGFLSEFPAVVTDYLCEQVRRHAMWSRLGDVGTRFSARHRMAGMIYAGIDRVLFSQDG